MLYGIGGEISTAILAFILEYFQEKLFKWSFDKLLENPKGFKCSNYLPSCEKSEQNNELFLRKMFEVLDGQADVQTVLDRPVIL